MNSIGSIKNVKAVKSVPNVKCVQEITGRENEKKKQQELERIAKIVFQETRALRPMFDNGTSSRKRDNYSKVSVSYLHIARRKIAGIVIEGKNKVAEGGYPDWENEDEVYNWELCKKAVKEAIPPNGENHFFMLGSNNNGKTPREKYEDEDWDNWPYDNSSSSVYGPFRNRYTGGKVRDPVIYIFFYTGPLIKR